MISQACGGGSESSVMETDSNEGSHSGLSIKNGSRNGTAFVDSSGSAFVFYYITTTITNDSAIPMRLTINFSKEKNTANGRFESPVFMLPRRQLTLENILPQQTPQVDLGMSKELEWFLDRVTKTPVSLDTVLSHKGKCVLNFGILNKVEYAEPYAIGLKAFTSSSSTSKLGLSFDRIPEDHYLIPCGEISYTPN